MDLARQRELMFAVLKGTATPEETKELDEALAPRGGLNQVLENIWQEMLGFCHPSITWGEKLIATTQIWNVVDVLVIAAPTYEEPRGPFTGVRLEIVDFRLLVEEEDIEVAIESALEALEEQVKYIKSWEGPVAGDAAWQKNFLAEHPNWFDDFARELRTRAPDYPG